MSFPVSSYRSCRQCSSSYLVVLILQVAQCLQFKVRYSFLRYISILPSISHHLAFLSFCLLANRHSLPMGTSSPHLHFFSFLSLSLLLSGCIGDWIAFVFSGLQKLLSQPISKSNCCFKFSPDAAIQNSNILRNSGFNLHNALLTDEYSMLSFGSKFKPVTVLELLLKHHPLWHWAKEGLEQGFQYAMEAISKTN